MPSDIQRSVFKKPQLSGVEALCCEFQRTIISGPTASMMPDPLFERGTTAIGSIKINNADRMLKILSEGGSGYNLYKECVNKTVFKKQQASLH